MKLIEINKHKLKRINAPKEGIKYKVLLMDVNMPYNNNYININPTPFRVKRNSSHGLKVAQVVKIINPQVEIFGCGFQSDLNTVVDYAIENGIRIIHTSLIFNYSEKREKAIKRFYDYGGIWIAGSGNNDDHGVYFPASSKYTIAVSATNTEDSNGAEVDTTADSWWKVFDQNNNMQSFDGTSASSPVITGVATYYLKNNPKGNLETFRNWLNVNEFDDLDKVLEYNPPFGKLEEGEEFFVFPDDLHDKEVEVDNNEIKLYPEWSQSQGEIYYIKNGEKVYMDTKPFIKGSRTFVPIRFVAEALGCKVEWDEEKGEVKIIQ